MAVEVSDWDVTEYLDSPEMIAAYLQAVMEENDPKLFQAAVGDVARAKGATAIAQEAGISRDTLYKSFSENGDPRLSTLISVLQILGLQFSIEPANENIPDDADASSMHG